MTHPVIFLSSTDLPLVKTGVVGCLTEPMPTLADFGGLGSTYVQKKQYEAALKSVMETAVRIENLHDVADWLSRKPESEVFTIPDKLYPLEGYGVELKQLSYPIQTVAIIHKLSDSKQESQQQLWIEIIEELRNNGCYIGTADDKVVANHMSRQSWEITRRK